MIYFAECYYSCDNVEIVKLLLSRIERSVKDHKGKSPLHFACE